MLIGIAILSTGIIRCNDAINFELNEFSFLSCGMQQVFVATLCVYPSVTVLVSSESRGNGHPWNDVYFVPVTNYLIFNSGDYLGRILAGLLEWVSKNMELSSENQAQVLLTFSLFHLLYSQEINRSLLPSYPYFVWHLSLVFCYAIQFHGIGYLFSSIPITFSF